MEDFTNKGVREKTVVDVKKLLAKKWTMIMPIIWIAYLIAYMDRVNIGLAQLSMGSDLGITAAEFGLASGIFFIGYFILEIPGTYIVERWSARKWIMRIMVTWGVVAVITGFIQNVIQLYILRFLLGLMEASFFPGIIVYITHWFTEDERARAVSLFMSAIPISTVVAAPISGLLLGVNWGGLAGWRWVFIAEGIPAIIWGFVILFALRDWPREAKWLTQEERDYLEKKYVEEKNSIPQERVKSIKRGLSHPWVILLAVIYFCNVTGNYALGFWVPTIIKELTGASNILVGVLTAVSYAIGAISMVLVGRHSDRTGERFYHFAIPMIISFIGMLIVSLAANMAIISYIGIIMAVAGIYPAVSVFWPVPQTTLAGEARAVAVGLVNSVGNLGGFVGPFIVGLLTSITGSYNAGTLVLSSLFLLGAILHLILRSQVLKSKMKGK